MRRIESRVLLSIVVVSFAASDLSGAASSEAGSPRPVTLASWSGAVDGVGQDAQSVAWCKGAGYHAEIHVLRLATRVERRVSGSCTASNAIAVAYPSLAWRSEEGAGATNAQTVLYTLDRGRIRQVAESMVSASWCGNVVGSPVSAGGELFYPVLRIDSNEIDCDLGETPSRVWIGGGHVYRIARGRGVAIPAFPPAAMIAASSGRIATVSPSTRKWAPHETNVTSVATNGIATVRESRTGAIITRFRPPGVITEIALTQKYAVVLVEDRAALRIEWYDAASGARIRHVPVSRTAAQLSASGNLASFSERTLIRLLDLQTGSVRNLWRASEVPVGTSPPNPVGLSINGNRVTWGENSKTFKSARVLALTLR